jgi:hypothetical protein
VAAVIGVALMLLVIALLSVPLTVFFPPYGLYSSRRATRCSRRGSRYQGRQRRRHQGQSGASAVEAARRPGSSFAVRHRGAHCVSQ